MKNLKETIEYKEYGFNIVKCPICGQETLDNHYVCENCNWEYDGTVDEETYSCVNNSCIKDYKKFFKNS